MTLKTNLLPIGVWCLFVMASTPAQGVPGGNNITPPPTPPDIKAKEAHLSALDNAAGKLYDARKYTQAIEAYQQIIETKITYASYVSPSGWKISDRADGEEYWIARCYIELGQPDKALSAYKRACAFGTNYRDLQIGSGQPVSAFMEYATLLARAGRKEDAKTVYYAGMRMLNTETNYGDPIPFRVVFDPDPEATVWPYSSQKLETAAMMGLAVEKWFLGQDLAQQVTAREPGWYLPVLVRVFFSTHSYTMQELEKNFAPAYDAARTPEEREIVRKVRLWKASHLLLDGAPEPKDLPRPLFGGLQILEEMRLRLKDQATWESIATRHDIDPSAPSREK